jgi:hypothetical protein
MENSTEVQRKGYRNTKGVVGSCGSYPVIIMVAMQAGVRVPIVSKL